MNRPARAAERLAVAIAERNAVTSVAQVNSGMRVHVMPGQRILMIVTMKLVPVIVLDTPMRKTPAHHSAVPGVCRLTGGYSVQPACGAPYRKLKKMSKPAGGKSQKLNKLSQGKATSRAPIGSGIARLPKPPVMIGMMTSHTIAVP